MNRWQRYALGIHLCGGGWQSLSYYKILELIEKGIAMLEPLPYAELTIRSSGTMRAWMHTNYRGEIDAIEVYSPISSTVVEMNPQADCLLPSNTSENDQ